MQPNRRCVRDDINRSLDSVFGGLGSSRGVMSVAWADRILHPSPCPSSSLWIPLVSHIAEGIFPSHPIRPLHRHSVLALQSRMRMQSVDETISELIWPNPVNPFHWWSCSHRARSLRSSHCPFIISSGCSHQSHARSDGLHPSRWGSRWGPAVPVTAPPLPHQPWTWMDTPYPWAKHDWKGQHQPSLHTLRGGVHIPYPLKSNRLPFKDSSDGWMDG